MRTAYKCRAYPDPHQQLMLARTFGCVRVVWNRTLAGRHERWATQRKGTSYGETDKALTAMKRLPELAFLNEVSSVPLQQTLRHQHAAFQAFFAGRARYPRFKSRRGRQTAQYTRSAFRWQGGQLWLGEKGAPPPPGWGLARPEPAAPGAQGGQPGPLPAAHGPHTQGIEQPGQSRREGRPRPPQGPCRPHRLPA